MKQKIINIGFLNDGDIESYKIKRLTEDIKGILKGFL